MQFLHLGQALDSWDHRAASTLLSLLPEVGLTTLLPNVLGWRFVWVPDNLKDTVVCMCVTWRALACSDRGSSDKSGRKHCSLKEGERNHHWWQAFTSVSQRFSFNYLGAEVGAMYPYCGKENLGSRRVSNLPQVRVASKQWSWTHLPDSKSLFYLNTKTLQGPEQLSRRIWHSWEPSWLLYWGMQDWKLGSRETSFCQLGRRRAIAIAVRTLLQ